MSFLTQAFIDFELAAKELRLMDIYDWHQLTRKAVPCPDGDPRDFLCRLDRQEREGRFRLLILSKRPSARPAGWPESPESWQSREITPAFLSSARYRFQLRANPTKREHVSRKRIALRSDEELQAWLSRKAEQGGFSVEDDSLRIIQEGREWFSKEKGGHHGFLHSVEFEGVLSVLDRAEFAKAFESGIGSAKAFGFGMLAIAPLS